MIPLHDDNPTRITPVVTIALIGLCVMAFLWQLSLGPRQEAAIYALGVIPAVILDHARLVSELEWVDPMLTPFTSMFLHGGFMHLGGNMLYLWIFGNNIEDVRPLARLVNLTELHLNNNRINDVEAFLNLQNLVDLDLRNNRIPQNQQALLRRELPNCEIRF